MLIRGVESPLWNQAYTALHTGLDLSAPFAHLDHYAEMRGARCLSISGGGPLGGGGSANPLASLYVGGNPPVNASVLAPIAERFQIIDDLKNGIVPVWVQDVAGSPMPRLNTFSEIDAPIDDVIEVTTNVGTWVDVLPRFKKSIAYPTERPDTITHEVLMDGGASDFNYQARVEFGRVEGGFQIRWRIQPRPDFQVDRKAKGLRSNTGSFTLAPYNGGTLMAYQIHVEADVNSFLLKVFKPIIMRVTLGEFDSVISAFANRSADRSWTRDCGRNPCGKDYRIRKV